MKNQLVIGISGASASGKTMFLNKISQYICPDAMTIIDMDGYHYHTRSERRELGEFPEDIHANNFLQLVSDINAIKSGKEVRIPTYNHKSGAFSDVVPVKSAPLVFVEGLHAGMLNAISNQRLVDYHLHVSPEENLRKSWKVKRDVEDRKYTYDEVISEIQNRTDFVNKYIKPQSENCHFLMNISRSYGLLKHKLFCSDSIVNLYKSYFNRKKVDNPFKLDSINDKERLKAVHIAMVPTVINDVCIRCGVFNSKFEIDFLDIDSLQNCSYVFALLLCICYCFKLEKKHV